jgi:hypothetical protein
MEKAEKVIVDIQKVLADAERAADAAVDAERAASKVAHGAEEAKGASVADDAASACSLIAGTAVVLADGTTKPIEQVKIGDVVLTTNSDTGKTEPHRVVGTDVHGNEPPRTEITVESGGKSGSVVATDWHPFWVEETGGWVEAGDLVAGEHLHVSDGSVAVITGVKHFTRNDDVFDLTVDAVHDFYVVVGAVSILTHNCWRRHVALPRGRKSLQHRSHGRRCGFAYSFDATKQ